MNNEIPRMRRMRRFARVAAGLSLLCLVGAGQAARASAKTPSKATTKVTKAVASSNTKGNITITISTVDFLKSDVVISVPAGTKAKRVVDSTSTVLTFPDGAQMTASPDASSFGDYKKNIVDTEKLLGTPASDKTTFLVDQADRLIFSDKSGPNLTKRTVFVMQKKLPALVTNELLAIGMLCSDTGLQEEILAPNRASLDRMMAACDSILSAK
jgi:hypothetical protein